MNWDLSTLLEATGGKVRRVGDRCFTGISTDSRTIKRGEIFIALKGERFDGHDFVKEALKRGGKGAIVERDMGVNGGTIIQVRDTLSALQDLAKYAREKRIFSAVIGITGTAGKSTAKEFIRIALGSFSRVSASPKSYNNLVGLPLSILNMDESSDYLVLEMGISLPGEMERLARVASPHISIFTSFGPAHLSGLGSLDRVREEKSVLLNFTSEGVISNADFPMFKNGIPGFKGWWVRFGLEKGEVVPLNLRFDHLYRPRVEFPEGSVTLPTPGRSGIYSLLGTVALIRKLNLPLGDALKALQNFSPLPGRMNLIEKEGYLILDDTYNSNPLAMEGFLEVMERIRRVNRRIAVLGDMRELGEKSEFYHRRLGERILSSSIDLVLTYGEYSRWVKETLGDRKPSFHFENKSALSSFLLDSVKKGDLIGVKGSRCMNMEEVVNVLSSALSS